MRGNFRKILFCLIVFVIQELNSTNLNAQITAVTSGTSTATTTSATLTINKPSGVTTGDIMLAVISEINGTTLTATTSTGWQRVASADLAGSTKRYATILYRIVTGTESSTYTFALPTSTNNGVGGIVSFRGVNNTTPFDLTPGSISVTSSASTSVAATSITSATSSATIVMFGMAASVSNATFTSWAVTSPILTEILDAHSSNNAVGVAWGIKATAGSTGAGSATLSASSRNGGLLIALRPGNLSFTAVQSLPTVALTKNQSTSIYTPVTASGGSGTYTYTISPSLPSGLTIVTRTGLLSGTVSTTIASTTYTVTIADGVSTPTSNTFSLSVNDVITTAQSIPIKTLAQNQAYTPFIPVTTSSGGTPSLTYSISPTLPTGLSIISSSGTISGTGTVSSTTTTYTVTVTDVNSATSTKTFQLGIIGTTTITSKALTKNIAASFTPVTASGGAGTYTYTITPSLPTGLSITSSTGQITGTGTATLTTTTYTVTATDANSGTSSKTFSLTINDVLTTTQAIANNVFIKNTVIASFSPVTKSGGTTPYVFTVSPGLPAGLTLVSTTGAISGTVTATYAATTYTMTVTDVNSATSSKTFSLTINDVVSTSQLISSKILTKNTATSFTPVTASGGAGTFTYTISPSLPAGLTLTSSSGLISGTATATSTATTYTIIATDASSGTSSKTFSLTVNDVVSTTQAIPSTILYKNIAASFTPVTASGGAGTYTYTISPSLPAGLSLTSNSGLISGTGTVTSRATTYTITATDVNTGTSSKTFNLTVNNIVSTAQVISSKVLTKSSPASFTPITASGGSGTYTFTITPSLPAGLTLTGSSGLISGTGTATSTATTYTITATDANSGTSSNTFSLTVNDIVSTTQLISTKVLTKSSATSFTPVTATGGAGTYTFTISPSLPAGLSLTSSSGLISGTGTATSTATTYTITVTDVNSGTSSKTFSLTVNDVVSTTVSISNKILAKSSATSFTPVTASGGTGTYTYTITPSLPAGLSFTSSSGLINGTGTATSTSTTYTITATDANSGTSSKTFSLSVNDVVSTSLLISSKVLTKNIATSFTPVTGSGGSGTYSYTISPLLPVGLTMAGSTGLITGSVASTHTLINYTVTVVDANGGTATNTFSLTLNDEFVTTQAIAFTSLTNNTAYTAFTPVTAMGGATAYTYTLSGGTLPAGMSYSTSTGQISGTPTAILSRTTFTVTVSDINSATSSKTFDLIVNTNVGISINPTITPFDCVSKGTISLVINGSGTAPYRFDWSDITGPINIQNRVGLSAGTYSVTVTDANEVNASLSMNVLDNSSACAGTSVCKSETASTFSVDPNAANTSYDWTVVNLDGSSVGHSTAITGTGNEININWTSYTLGSYKVCVITSNTCSVSEQKCQTVYVKQPDIAVFADPTCIGATLNLHAYGGGNFSWTGPNSFTSNLANPLIYNTTSAANGTYTLTTTDINGCSASTAATVNVALNPKPNISSTTIVPTSTCTGAGNGSVTLNTLSGSNTPTFSWTKVGTPSYAAITKDISGLATGSYSVNVSNVEGCSNSFTYFVSSSESATFSVTASAPTITCFGGVANATSVITGSITGASYSWSNASGTITSTMPNLAAVPVGAYNLVVTDGTTHCSANTSVTITQPSAPISAEASLTNVNCYGRSTGAITITAKGGIPNYTYSWVGPNAYTHGNDATITGLAAGTYTVTVTDAGGGSCSSINAYTITQPAGVITTTSTGSAVSCFGSSDGILNLTTSGGTSPYTYSWSKTVGIGFGSYTASTSSISSLSAGTYVVNITDNKGCSITSSGYVVTQPAAALTFASPSITNVNCYGGSTGALTINAQGGTSAYTYAWTNGSTSNTLTNLTAGTYTATVTDSKGCVYTQGYAITQPAAALTASAVTTAPSCNAGSNGSIALTVSGGTTAYTYAWTEDEVGSYNASTKNISALSAGTYNVIVTDANNCTVATSATILNPAALTVSGSITNVLCNASTTGAINITAAGGTGAFTYNWGNSITTEDRTSLGAGTYSVTVKDANNCTVNGSYTITQPNAISLSMVNTNLSCNAKADGAIVLTTTGGAGAYTYAWTGPSSFTATTKNINGLSVGVYTVVVTDANNCTATKNSTSITQPAVLSVSVPTSTNVNCFNAATGAATALATGGTIGTGYNYSWSDGTIGASLSNVSANTYTINVVDANGCSANTNVSIAQPEKAIALYTTATDTRACAGTPSGKIDLVATYTTGTLSYVWAGPTSIGNIQSPTNLAAGNYTVVLTDANGCTANASSTVGTSAALAVTVSGYSRTCAKNPDGSAYAIVTGGVAPYSYLWSNSATTQSINSLLTDTYSVAVTDANGCNTTASVTLTAPVCDVPTAVTDVFVSANGGTISSSVATNDIDLAYTPSDLQFQLLATPDATQGSIVSSADGSFTFTPTPGYTGTIEIPYLVTNPIGLSDKTTLTIYVSSINVSSGVISTTCTSGGTISITVTGGFPAYTYSWLGDGAFASSQEDLIGLSAGTYSLTTTDAKGASIVSTYTVLDGCINSGSLTSTIYIYGPNSFIFTGDPQGPTTTNKTGSTGAITFSYVGTFSTTYDASDSPPSAFGTYKAIASIAADGTYSSATSLDFPFTIEKLATSITVKGLTSFNYNGSTQGPSTSTVVGSTGAVTYSYKGAGLTTYGPSASAPLLTGSYEVIATVVGDDNYNGASSSAFAFSIVTSSSTITVTGLTTYTYNTTGQGPITSSVSGSTALPNYLYYGVRTTIYNANSILPSGAGTYEAIASVDADANYKAATSNVFSFTINKANSTIVTTGGTSYTYNGSAQGPATSTVVGSTTAVTYSYSGTGSTVYGPTATKPTSVGTYEVVATLPTDANYNGAVASAYAFTIIKANSTIAATGATSYTYNGNAQGPTTSTVVGSTGALAYSYSGTGSTVYGPSATMPNSVGAYQVIVTLIGDANFNGAVSTPYAFTIGKANSTIVAKGVNTYIYNASSQGPASSTVTGSAGSVTYSYSGTGETMYTASAIAPVNVGTYQLIATVAADANYNGASSAAYTFTISNPTATKGSSTITPSGITTYIYYGLTQGPSGSTVTGAKGVVIYTYSGTGATIYASSTTPPINPGTYQVIATVAGDANYDGAESTAFPFIIIPAASTIKVTGLSTYTYNSSAQGPSASTVKGSTGAVTYSYSGTGLTKYLSSNNAPKLPGTYQVIATVVGDNYYDGASSAAFEFEIIQNNTAPIAKNARYIYNQQNTPANIAILVNYTPAGTIPVWCELNTTNCSIVAPKLPTIIGSYVYQLRSYDTTTLLYSSISINDTVIIAPPIPDVIDSTYVLGVLKNPTNISLQVKGLSGAYFNYYYLNNKLSATPTLGTLPVVKKYTVSQTLNSIESDTASFYVTILDPQIIFHLQETVDTGKLQANSTFNYKFNFIVSNLTGNTINNVVLSDNFKSLFPINSDFNIISNKATGNLIANSKYDGISDINLTEFSSKIFGNSEDTINVEVNIIPKGYSGTLFNSSSVQLDTKWGLVNVLSTTDSKFSGSTNKATPYIVKDLDILIPEGFSPNYDGINDKFIIIKPYDVTIDLEVFNRWGNIVYKSTNYKNDWDGKGTNNFIGQDLINGGYYYVIKASNYNGGTKVFNGYVIIQR